MIKLLHFSDTHIDMANRGKRDPQSGLPIRVNDFLAAFDKIIDFAIDEKVDLVLFAGDAYRDRTPAPTFQREWGKRMLRLSQAKIPTLLLVGNHDTSPAFGRAHALQEFETLEIPYIKVISKPAFFGPNNLDQLPVQVIGLPWISRSTFISALDSSTTDMDIVYDQIEERIGMFIQNCLENANPDLPIIFTAHASVQGAAYGGERFVMLGKDQVLSGGLVKNPLFDYVALGHIHKPQNLNEGQHPPVIYPGSIERVDFGEAEDQKFFVLAEINKGQTNLNWIPLNGRKFEDSFIDLQNIYKHGFSKEIIPTPQEIRDYLEEYLPEEGKLQNAICRLRLVYPRDWETLIDESWVREWYQNALEFQFVRKPVVSTRLRLAEDQEISAISTEELLTLYLQTIETEPEEIKILQELAQEFTQHRDKMITTE